MGAGDQGQCQGLHDMRWPNCTWMAAEILRSLDPRVLPLTGANPLLFVFGQVRRLENLQVSADSSENLRALAPAAVRH